MTTLTALQRTDEEYAKIYKEFTKELMSCKIHSIIKIDMPSNITKKHETFKKSNSSQAVRRLFHGTKYSCDFIKSLSDIEKMCKSEGCGVCGIIRYGPKTNGGHAWFGATPIVSHDYTGIRFGYPTLLDLRAIFIMDVVSTTLDYNAYTISKQEAALPRYLVTYSI